MLQNELEYVVITVGDGAAVAVLSLPGKAQTAATRSLKGRASAGGKAEGCSPRLAIHQAPFRVLLEWIQVLLF